MKISTLITKLKKSTFWKSVVVLVSGTALAQLIGLVTTPIVSRLYDPTSFGEYAIIVSTATIIINIVTLGLNHAVMMPTSDEESDDVFMVAFFTMLFFATIILAILISLSSFKHFFNAGLNYIVSCILIYGFVIIEETKSLLSIYINRKKLNRVLFYNPVIGALATLFITIPLGLIGLNSIGLITAAILAGVASIVQMLYHANPFKKLPSINTIISIYKKYKDFILYQYPSNIMWTFAVQLPTQVFSSVFGNANLGSYSMNEKILGIPLRLVGTPISTIYFRTSSEYSKEGKDLAKFTFSLITKIMLIAFIPIAISIMWGEKIFTWVLGSKWDEAGRMVGFLIVQYVFMFCTTCTSSCRVSIGKQKVNFIMSMLRVCIIGLSIFLGISIFGDLFNTIIFFSVGSSIYLIIDMTMNFYCMGKYFIKYTVFAVSYIIIIAILWILSGLF